MLFLGPLEYWLVVNRFSMFATDEKSEFVELHISHDLVNTFNFSFTIEMDMLSVDTDGSVL